jgi:hypothetical protein
VTVGPNRKTPGACWTGTSDRQRRWRAPLTHAADHRPCRLNPTCGWQNREPGLVGDRRDQAPASPYFNGSGLSDALLRGPAGGCDEAVDLLEHRPVDRLPRQVVLPRPEARRRCSLGELGPDSRPSARPSAASTSRRGLNSRISAACLLGVCSAGLVELSADIEQVVPQFVEGVRCDPTQGTLRP